MDGASRKTSCPFRPSRQQQTYLEAWLDPRSPKTIAGIASNIGVARRSIYNWFERPEFVRWFNAEIEHHTDHLWQPVLYRLTEFALAGSIEHMRLLVQIRGALRPEITRHDGRSFVVMVGVPRPQPEDISTAVCETCSRRGRVDVAPHHRRGAGDLQTAPRRLPPSTGAY